MLVRALAVLLAVTALSVVATPAGLNSLQSRAAPDNIVSIAGNSAYCMIMPRTPHTDIGDSEETGRMQTFCSASAKTSSAQGQLPSNFWSNIAFLNGKGKNGGRYAQLTGCIRPGTLDRLNPGDAGGQYDSSGGAGGQGNPQGSACIGYNHYVELVEPSDSRACIKCCDDPVDCPTNMDTSGCPAVIPGNYFNCG